MRWELDWLENRARLTPDKKALIDESSNQSWTYAEINHRAAALASWFRGRGVKKGDRIALMAPNHISYFDILFACAKMGTIFVPLNWRLSKRELLEIVDDCSPVFIGLHHQFRDMEKEFLNSHLVSFFIDDEEYERILREHSCYNSTEELKGHDPLLMIYTGGTTGKPKGVVLSHESILWNGINTILSWGLTDNDVTINYLPMFHTGGLNALSVPILLIGGTVAFSDGFSGAKTVEAINRLGCTIILLVPTMYHALIQTEEFHSSEFPTMKLFLSGAAPCPYPIYEAFQKKNLAFKEGYGLSEAGPNNFYIHPADALKKKGSVGKPMMFNQIRLEKEDGQEAEHNEVGELLIRGKHSFSHYWNNNEATAEALQGGWLRTGDLAKKDEDGFYYIVGRKKDMIITGGENVYPLEVEHWIASHPAIDEVAVIGLPDDKWGEAVTAFIVVKESYALNEEELKTHCSQKLGSYKIPKRFILVSELPKTHVGKIDKKKLKEFPLRK